MDKPAQPSAAVAGAEGAGTRPAWRLAFAPRIVARPANDNSVPLARRIAMLAPWLLCGALVALAYLLGAPG